MSTFTGSPPLPSYADYRERLRGEHLPLAYVDLERLLANAASLVARCGGKPIRLASKSIRCRELMRRVMATSPVFQGVLCFSAGEAAHLAADGFTDLVVAYPTVDAHDLAAVCAQVDREAAQLLQREHGLVGRHQRRERVAAADHPQLGPARGGLAQRLSEAASAQSSATPRCGGRSAASGA